jgi:hypothetical protein
LLSSHFSHLEKCFFKEILRDAVCSRIYSACSFAVLVGFDSPDHCAIRPSEAYLKSDWSPSNIMEGSG